MTAIHEERKDELLGAIKHLSLKKKIQNRNLSQKKSELFFKLNYQKTVFYVLKTHEQLKHCYQKLIRTAEAIRIKKVV